MNADDVHALIGVLLSALVWATVRLLSQQKSQAHDEGARGEPSDEPRGQ